MKIRLGWISWATGTLMLVAVTSCSDTGADPPASPLPSTTPSVTKSTAPPSPSEVAAADATQVVRDYFAVLDRVRQDPSAPLSELAKVMIGIELEAETHLVTSERSRKLHQTGSTEILKLTVQSVNLDNSDPAAGKVPTASIDVCWDVSGADLIDQNGKSVVKPSRPDRGWTRYFLANRHWKADPSGGWRVENGQDLKQAPCAAQ